MKILITSTLYPFPQTPWRGTFVHDHVHLLKEAGHDIRVIAPRPWVPFGWERRNPSFRGLREVPKRMNLGGVRVEAPVFKSIPGGRSPRWVARQLRRSARKIARRWNDWTPDLVHSHTILPSCHLAIEYGKVVESPVLATVPGWDFDEGVNNNRETFRELLSSLSALLLMRESQRSVAVDLEYTGKMHVLPYPVIVEGSIRVAEGTLLEGENAPERVFNVLFPAGPERPEKNFKLFSEAIEGLRLIHGFNIDVSTLGGLNHADTLDKLRQADLVVYTSTREGAPIVAREAVAVGTRVCAVNIGDLADWLPKAVIAESPTAEGVADVIRASLAMDGTAWTLPEHFMPEHSTKRHIEIYEQIIADY